MGGKAFAGITSRVQKKDVFATLDWLETNWLDFSLQTETLKERLLGSAGKNEDSGDIDLNMRIEVYDQEKVARDLIDLLGEDHVKPRPSHNQIFTAVPIAGDPTNGYVQVDFMFGDYEWQKFSYFSARHDPSLRNHYWKQDPTVSVLKGLYRTELIKALVAFNSDWVLEENGEMIARVGPTFFHDKGCVWRYRHRPMRKDGTGRIKELKELTKEEFLELYPSAITARTDVIKDPLKVAEMILSERSINLDHLATVETIITNMWSCYTAPEMAQITKIYLERLNSLKVVIPVDVFKSYRMKV